VDSIVDAMPHESTRSDRRSIERNLERLYRVVWKDEVIAYYTEKDQSLDRVLDIFIRANDGGTKLSKSDLLLSMVTSKWEGVSARQEIFGLVDHLNDGLAARNELSKDFVMKACLVLTGLDVAYTANNFDNRSLAIIESEWPAIKTTLERTLLLVNSFGIDKESLSSVNVLMPIAYYIHEIDAAIDGSTPFEAVNRVRVQRFVLACLLNRVFGGTSDQTISTARGIIRDALRRRKDFPLEELIVGLAKRGRIAAFNDETIPALFEIGYGKKPCFLALSLLYDTDNWGVTSTHIDHIIPRALADRRTLMAANVPETRIEQIQASLHRLGNLELLLGRENLEKNALPFEEWMRSRDQEFMERHLIPTDRSLWTAERLPEFVRERESLIRKKVRGSMQAMDTIVAMKHGSQ
jgi:hypothetical protein